MEQSGLQRSTTSFRRQGSSGLIWDDKFLSEDLNQMSINNRRSRSNGGDGNMYRTTMKAQPPPSFDPPSPKVSGCGLCGGFGKPGAAKKRRSNKRKY
ncbi:MAPK SUBSTRATES IN THE STOMATAL LINEAGE 1 [Hibiscus trionum]|uniref:MAPK SUBSTRATES IN THE STOMATAL LINEAGE 1 n=1 Tax=Hibiscus trionum TaxID=183268 RepID=A0A9W7MEC6_HIBTR|nr:MAPK SUBSTRATES IN THE STOMATAL LINEAGE 1 [Hibiscus trionum]